MRFGLFFLLLALLGSTLTKAEAQPIQNLFWQTKAGGPATNSNNAAALKADRVYFIEVRCRLRPAAQVSNPGDFLKMVRLGSGLIDRPSAYVQFLTLENLAPAIKAGTGAAQDAGGTATALPLFYAQKDGAVQITPTGYCGQQGYFRVDPALGQPMMQFALVVTQDAALVEPIKALGAFVATAGTTLAVQAMGGPVAAVLPAEQEKLTDLVGPLIDVALDAPAELKPVIRLPMRVGEAVLETDAMKVWVHVLDRDRDIDGAIVGEEIGGRDEAFLTGLVPFSDSWDAFMTEDETFDLRRAAERRDFAACQQLLDRVQDRARLSNLDVGFMGLVSFRPSAQAISARAARDCLGWLRSCAVRGITGAGGGSPYADIVERQIASVHRLGAELDDWCAVHPLDRIQD